MVKGHIDQWDKQSSERDPHKHSQFFFDRGTKVMQWNKNNLFKKWCWNPPYIIVFRELVCYHVNKQAAPFLPADVSQRKELHGAVALETKRKMGVRCPPGLSFFCSDHKLRESAKQASGGALGALIPAQQPSSLCR